MEKGDFSELCSIHDKFLSGVCMTEGIKICEECHKSTCSNHSTNFVKSDEELNKYFIKTKIGIFFKSSKPADLDSIKESLGTSVEKSLNSLQNLKSKQSSNDYEFSKFLEKSMEKLKLSLLDRVSYIVESAQSALKEDFKKKKIQESKAIEDVENCLKDYETESYKDSKSFQSFLRVKSNDLLDCIIFINGVDQDKGILSINNDEADSLIKDFALNCQLSLCDKVKESKLVSKSIQVTLPVKGNYIPFEEVKLTYAYFSGSNFYVFSPSSNESSLINYTFDFVQGYTMVVDYFEKSVHILTGNTYSNYNLETKEITKGRGGMPYFGKFHNSLVTKDRLYLIGNWDNGVNSSNLNYWNKEDNKGWKQLASMNYGRNSAAVAVLGDFIYVFGGYGGYDGWTQISGEGVVERYSISNNKWEVVSLSSSDYKGGIYSKAVAISDTEILFAGGMSTSTSLSFPTGFIFNSSDCTITKTDEIPELKKCNSDSVYYLNWVHDPVLTFNPKDDSPSVLFLNTDKDMHFFDLTNRKWSKHSDFNPSETDPNQTSSTNYYDECY